jgi:hypothetical protein
MKQVPDRDERAPGFCCTTQLALDHVDQVEPARQHMVQIEAVHADDVGATALREGGQAVIAESSAAYEQSARLLGMAGRYGALQSHGVR